MTSSPPDTACFFFTPDLKSRFTIAESVKNAVDLHVSASYEVAAGNHDLENTLEKRRLLQMGSVDVLNQSEQPPGI